MNLARAERSEGARTHPPRPHMANTTGVPVA